MTDYTKIVKSLPETVPFVGPETQERDLGFSFISRLGANESVFGPSKSALDIIKSEGSKVWQYGDPECYELRTELARKHGVSLENIVVGEGIDGLLGYLIRLFVSIGDNVVTTDGAYPTFNYHVLGFGGNLLKVPFSNDTEDLNALLDEAVRSKAKIVYCSNPNNPMGSVNDPKRLLSFLEELPPKCVLCLDEAYCDFLDGNMLPNISIDHPNVIRMRTFSKAYGLAGLRCGYALACKDLIKSFDKIRNHFGVNKVAQSAAVASLNDNEHILTIKKRVRSSLDKLSEIAIKNDCIPIYSNANFLSIDCRRDASFTKKLVDELARRKVFVRRPFSYPQNRCVRVSAGTDDDMRHFEKAFKDVLTSIN